MKRSFPRSQALAGWTLVVVMLAVPPASLAALGGDVASIAHDHETLHASDVVTSTVLYDLHEAQSAAGVRVREYVDRVSGKVFALTWQGPRLPDLNGLLGAYAARYQAAAKEHHGSHHALSIDDPDLKISVLRLQRGWAGDAYLPNAIPQGVDRAELR